jgi:hypothetical protein
VSVLVVSVGVPLFAAVAAYSSNTGSSQFGYGTGAGAQERATFVLAPLFLIGLMVWLRDRPGSFRAVAAAAIIAAVIPATIPATIPLGQFKEAEVSLHAFSLVPWVGAEEHTAWPIGLLVFTSALAAGFFLLARMRARTAAFLAPVVATFVLVTLIAQTVIEVSSDETRSAGVGASPDWVDRVAGGSDVSILWSEGADGPSTQNQARHRVVWVNEFFNRSLGTVYQLGAPQPFAIDLRSTPVARLSDGRIVLPDGSAAPIGPLILAPCHVRVEGEMIARDSATGAVVYRVDGGVRATTLEPGSC